MRLTHTLVYSSLAFEGFAFHYRKHLKPRRGVTPTFALESAPLLPLNESGMSAVLPFI
jgi:hypothetical protein